VFVGVPVWSATVFASRHDADVLSMFVHAFLVGMVFNVVDWLLLDELWLGVGKPRWALPQGVAPADVLPFDHAPHFRAFLNGTWFFTVIAAFAALAAPGLVGASASGPRACAILAEDPAPILSDYGLFLDAASREPSPGVVPYDLVSPLFSHHAAKHRFVHVPKGQHAAYDPEGAFDFP